MADLAVVILTYNEERHIGRALDSVSMIADEIFVIDSFSTDQTLNIAKSRGASILQNPFVNQAQQFQWALDNAPIKANWVMRLDADEIIEPDLAKEIKERLSGLPSSITGVNLKRKLIFLGRRIKFGGRGFLVMLRIWRRGLGQIEDRWMDEHLFVREGTTVTFNGGFSDHNLNDLSHFTEKHNKYATREAIEVLNQRLCFMASSATLSKASSSRQAALKRLLKEHLYNRIPFQLSAIAYFIYRYAFRLGFLDGKEGLIYNVLQGFWYRFLVGAKVQELERAIQGLTDTKAIAAELARLTGLHIKASEPQLRVKASDN